MKKCRNITKRKRTLCSEQKMWQAPEGENPDETSVSEFKPFDEVKEGIKKSMLFRERENNSQQNDCQMQMMKYMKILTKKVLSVLLNSRRNITFSHIIPTNRNNGTNYFTKDELREVIIDLPEFPKQVFEREVNDPSTPISSTEGKLIFRVIEKVESHIPPYEEVHDKVAEDLRYEKAFEEAEKVAGKCLEKTNQTSLEEGVEFIKDDAGKLAIIETKYVSRPGIISKDDDTEILGSDRVKITDAAFGLKVGESAIAVENRGEKTCYVVKLVERKKVDPKVLKKKEI